MLSLFFSPFLTYIYVGVGVCVRVSVCARECVCLGVCVCVCEQAGG